MATDLSRPKMTLGGEMEGDGYGEFLGVVGRDDWELGKSFDGKEPKWQWVLGVWPVDYRLGGKTGMWHTYYTLSPKAKSKMGKAREAMQNIFPGDLVIGEHQLEGHVCYFQRMNLEFGENRDTGEKYIAEDVLVPTKPATLEEQVRAKKAWEAFKAGGGVETAATAPVQDTPPAEITDEVRQQAQDLIPIDGATREEITRLAIKSKLPREVKQGLMSGKLIDALVAAGHLLDDEGKIFVVPF